MTTTTETDETLEPDLEAFCRTALKLAKNGITHSEMTTDTGVVLAVQPQSLWKRHSTGGSHEYHASD